MSFNHIPKIIRLRIMYPVCEKDLFEAGDKLQGEAIGYLRHTEASEVSAKCSSAYYTTRWRFKKTIACHRVLRR